MGSECKKGNQSAPLFKGIETISQAGTSQPVNTAVNLVALAFPGRTNSIRRGVHPKDLGTVANHLAITPGGQADDAGSNNDY